jgi:hypothetical protein
MDGPELLARDLALLATSNPEAFWSALHQLHDALAKVAHPDAGLLALGAELRALCEAVHAGPADAAPEEADDRLATAEELIATLVPATGAGLAVKLRLAWLWWIEDGAESRHGPNDDSDDRTRLLWRLIGEAEALDRPGAGEAR